MSAYMVEDNTINNVLAYLRNPTGHNYSWCVWLFKEHGYDITTRQGLARLGVRMFALNARAVNERYGHNQAQEFRTLDYQFKTVIPPTEIQAYKSLQCWLYQCSEGNVPDTRLYKLMTDIKHGIAEEIIDRLPAYDLAKWG